MKNKGITLVALVVTIILLLILAGITITQLTGSGLFENARLAEEKSQNAQEKENETLEDYENKIGEYVDGSRDTVTISKEEYESLKPSSVSSDAKLMTSTDTDLKLSTRNLTNFENVFSDNFEEYFSYDTTTGEITCNKERWYCIAMNVNLYTNSSHNGVKFECYINDICLGYVYAYVNTGSYTGTDGNNITLYLKKGDKMKFVKTTSGGANVVKNNIATLNIYKI